MGYWVNSVVQQSHFIPSFLILSYLILSYLILSHLILSYPIVSFLVLTGEIWGIGSTPSCSKPPANIAEMREVHPGNYVFNDFMQVLIGIEIRDSLMDVLVTNEHHIKNVGLTDFRTFSVFSYMQFI